MYLPRPWVVSREASSSSPGAVASPMNVGKIKIAGKGNKGINQLMNTSDVHLRSLRLTRSRGSQKAVESIGSPKPVRVAGYLLLALLLSPGVLRLHPLSDDCLRHRAAENNIGYSNHRSSMFHYLLNPRPDQTEFGVLGSPIGLLLMACVARSFFCS